MAIRITYKSVKQFAYITKYSVSKRRSILKKLDIYTPCKWEWKIVFQIDFNSNIVIMDPCTLNVRIFMVYIPLQIYAWYCTEWNWKMITIALLKYVFLSGSICISLFNDQWFVIFFVRFHFCICYDILQQFAYT